MRHFPKPVVVVSRCLGFGNCRFDGEGVQERFIASLAKRVKVIPFCPEAEVGLTGKREPLRLVQEGESLKLMQMSSGLDFTAKVKEVGAGFMDSLEAVDGFVLKGRCPTCAFKDVTLFQEGSRLAQVRSAGLFGGMVLERYGHLPIEDEGRLTNFRLREHFLTHLFIRAELRELRSKNESMNGLIAFHSKVKLQLMACSQTDMRKLGQITANHEHLPVPEVFDLYEQNLGRAFNRVPRYTSNINVLQHVLGYFKGLTSKERAHFQAELDRYRDQKSPLSVPLAVARSWVERFDVKYLADQYFFEPYPEELANIEDSGRGRRDEMNR